MQTCMDTIERDVEKELEDEYRKLEEEVARKQAKMIREFEERKQNLVEERRAKEDARRKMEEERATVEEAKRRAEEEKWQREEDSRRIAEEEEAKRLKEEECQRLREDKAAQIESPRAEASVRLGVKKVAEQVIKGTESFEELKRVIRELEKMDDTGEDEVEEEAATMIEAPVMKKTRLPMIEAGSHLRAVSGKVSRKHVCRLYSSKLHSVIVVKRGASTVDIPTRMNFVEGAESKGKAAIGVALIERVG
jgi:hypothetical protein